MSPQLHSLVGGTLLGVALLASLWAFAVARRQDHVPRSLTVGVLLVVGLLLVEILLGMDLWVQAGIPGLSLRGMVHAGGPIVALIVALGLILGEGRRSAGRYAVAMLVIAGLSLLSYAIRLIV